MARRKRRSHKRRARARRSNPSNPRRHRRHRARHGRRRRNPARSGRVSWTTAFLDVGVGLGAGAVAYGIDWGISMIPVSPIWQGVIFGVTGAVGAIALAKFNFRAAAAGLVGGTGYGLIGRVREILALNKIADQSSTASSTSQPEAPGAPVSRGIAGAGRVREAGAVTSMSPGPNYGPQFSRNPRGGAGNVNILTPPGSRMMGPHSWIYETGRVERVSAHNRRRAA